MIREKIKEELTRKNWSILTLSKETGIRNASLTEYLNGNKELFSDNIVKIFKVLDIGLSSAGFVEGNRKFFQELKKEDLNEQLALLVVCLAYRSQERQTALLDIRPFEYWNGNKNMVKIEPLLRALLPGNFGELEIEAARILKDSGKKAIEIGENDSIEFMQGLLMRRE